MLFHSPLFLFVFLPVIFVGAFLLPKKFLLGWLVLASFIFYGWNHPQYILILGVSVLTNFVVGRRLEKQACKSTLAVGIACNIALLGYFKYTHFFLSAMNDIAGTTYSSGAIFLPLGISFYTFHQIAYIVDAYRGKTTSQPFLQYCLFVTFFPQLIAGPIARFEETMSQYSSGDTFRPHTKNIAIGLTIFIIGLFKKVVLADTMEPYVAQTYFMAKNGIDPPFLFAWLGALSYTMQLYFDFSGYADMAIGLARLFGIQLPTNFNSPYRATNISEFWQKWHMTLSRFLRDYLYIPLGGSHKGFTRTGMNLLVTMVLGGLWHGAGWTFLIWGCMHGLYLLIHHAWRSCHDYVPPIPFLLSWPLTFGAIVISWVIFRAETTAIGINVLQGMFSFNTYFSPLVYQSLQATFHTNIPRGWVWVFFLLCIVLFAPNTEHILQRWNQTRRSAAALALMTMISISFIGLHTERPFLYFQF